MLRVAGSADTVQYFHDYGQDNAFYEHSDELGRVAALLRWDVEMDESSREGEDRAASPQ